MEIFLSSSLHTRQRLDEQKNYIFGSNNLNILTVSYLQQLSCSWKSYLLEANKNVWHAQIHGHHTIFSLRLSNSINLFIFLFIICPKIDTAPRTVLIAFQAHHTRLFYSYFFAYPNRLYIWFFFFFIVLLCIENLLYFIGFVQFFYSWNLFHLFIVQSKLLSLFLDLWSDLFSEQCSRQQANLRVAKKAVGPKKRRNYCNDSERRRKKNQRFTFNVNNQANKQK